MHLILSKNYDFSTNEVCEWFIFHGYNFTRVNSDFNSFGSIHGIDLSQEPPTFLNEHQNLNSSFLYNQSFQSVWYRRPLLDYNNLQIESYHNSYHSEILDNAIILNNKNECSKYYEFLISSIKAGKFLGDFNKTSLNKLIVLELAKEIGIQIPASIITSKKDDLIQFLLKCKNGVITKSIAEGINARDSQLEMSFISYTGLVDDDCLAKIPDNFSPSLFQEHIIKQFEVRVFYLDGKFYSMAIFSQNNEKTKVDFRNYDTEMPNRCVPYLINDKLCQQLTLLMKEIGINNGSIDIIINTEGDSIFLEVNPVGQFGMVSTPCNYNLEYLIFEYLTSHKK